jgi:uroporphyrinogen-III decarboxylase
MGKWLYLFTIITGVEKPGGVHDTGGMKSKERARTAMSNGKPDRVPVIPQLCPPHAIRMLGLNYEETVLKIIRQPSLANELDFECAKQYGFDGLRVWMDPDPMDVMEVDGRWYGRDPKTGERLGLVDFEGGGGIVPSEEPTIRTQEDIDRIEVESADKILASGRLNSLEKVIRAAGDDMFVSTMPGSFTMDYVTAVRGKAQALMDVMDEPEFVHAMMDKALAVTIARALAAAKLGVDAFYIGDAYGGVISPNQFREFCVPYIKRFVQAVKGKGPLVYHHVCGNSRFILEAMADTGVDCIEPLDPLGGVEVKDAKRRVGKRVALMGGVNTVKLAHGTLQEVIDDCRRCLTEGAPGGGYILASGDMLPTETSTEKVRAMVEAAQNYRYS